MENTQLEKINALNKALGDTEIDKLSIVSSKGNPFVSREFCLVLDCSGSMDSTLEDGTTYFEEMLSQIKQFNSLRKIYVWNSQARVDIAPERPSGSTPLHLGMAMASAHGHKRIIVISDGYPDYPEYCFEEAKKFDEIHTIYIGTDSSYNENARKFLADLASNHKGSASTTDLNKLLLSDTIKNTLLIGEGNTSSSTINL